MPIRQRTPQSEVDRHFSGLAKRFEAQVLYQLGVLGEACINKARERGSYRDDTGNLRSSVGYIIAIDGKIHKQFFEPIENAKDGKTGVGEAEELARKVLEDYPEGIVLIVVAGMKYASYVANRGYDVIDSAEVFAKKNISKMMKQITLGDD